MLTRRQLAGALGLGPAMPAACVAAPASPPPAAAADPFALAPLVGSNWARHQSGTAPQLLQLAAGVRLRAGPMGAVDRNGLAIWSRAAWPERDFQARLKTRKLDRNVGAGPQSLYLLLYFGVQGDGTAGHPTSPAAWPAGTVPFTHAYAQHIRGARLTFYFQPAGSTSETQPVALAWFNADGSRRSLRPVSPVSFVQERDVAHDWTVRRLGETVTVTQAVAGKAETVTFRDPILARLPAPQHFGFLVSPGRDAQVTGFAVAAA